jgi:cytochrome P450
MTRLRGASRRAFSPSALRFRFEPIVRRKVIELLEPFVDAGHADFARDLARPLPGTTMFSWFGFPEDDHPQLLAWFGDVLEHDPASAPCQSGRSSAVTACAHTCRPRRPSDDGSRART